MILFNFTRMSGWKARNWVQIDDHLNHHSDVVLLWFQQNVLVNRGLRFVGRSFSERNVLKSFSIFLMLFIISMFRLFSWLFQSSSTLAFNLPVWRSRQLLVRTAAAQIMRKLNWLLHRLVMENETTNNKNNKIIGKLMLARYFWELKIIDNFTETKTTIIPCN